MKTSKAPAKKSANKPNPFAKGGAAQKCPPGKSGKGMYAEGGKVKKKDGPAEERAEKKGSRKMCAEGGGITFGQGFLGTKPVDESDASALRRGKPPVKK